MAEVDSGTVYFGIYASLEDHFPNFSPLLAGLAIRLIPALEAADFKRRFGTAFLLRKTRGDLRRKTVRADSGLEGIEPED